jgi:hypothetical protein
MNRATIARVGSLAPVAGLLYVVTHFGTVTTIAAAGTIGCAVWAAGKVKKAPQTTTAPIVQAPSDEQIVMDWQPPAALPVASTVNPADVQRRLAALRKQV